MMEDDDLKRLRPYGAMLRQEIDVARLVAATMERVRTPPGVTAWLAELFRPAVAAAIIAAVLTGATAYWREHKLPDLVSEAETRILTEVADDLR